MSEDVFEITDFTTASDWERFVSDLEEVITRWQLCGKDSSEVTENELTFGGVWTQKQELIRFSKTIFSLVYYKSKEDNESEEWPIGGVNSSIGEYFGIKSFLLLSTKESEILSKSEDKLRLLLSSVSMALNSTHCCLPLLIEWSKERHLFSGIAFFENNMRKEFQIIQISRNSRFKYLNEFLELINREFEDNNEIKVSIRLTFIIKRFKENYKQNNRLLLEEEEEEDIQEKEPLLQLQMAAVWPSLASDAVIDSKNHSDLDPNSAEKWTLRAIFKDSIECPLSDCLDLLMSLRNNKNQILDQMIEEKDIKDAFIPLTNECPNEKWIRDLVREEVFNERKEEELSFLIAICISKVFSKQKDLKDLSIFWMKIINNLRKSWEMSRILRLKEGLDLNSNLFQQKLQMINICILEKRKEEDNNEEEEFFDCNEEEEEEEELKPEGRLRISELKRVNDSSQYIWIPLTQECPPMTEDMINEQLILLQSLGTSAQSASLRARIQSASLVSYMEAFKAANIGSLFEDFIRWHSPRDCDSSGQLSARFLTPDNIWRQVWDNSRPVAAKRQKKLFDFTTEAEKVLHFLTSLSFGDLVDLMIPFLIDYCLKEVNESNVFRSDCRQKRFESVLSLIREKEIKIIRLKSLSQKLRIDSNISEEEIKELAEKLVSKPEIHIQSFGPFGRLIKSLFAESLLLEYESRTTIGEREESSMDKKSSFPDPISREFVLHVMSARPSSYSRLAPQRLYSLWTERETRLASAFTNDLIYF